MDKTFFDKKPIIGMVHLLPLPGSPGYGGNMQEIYDAALFDLDALTQGGADAFIIENFGDVPYASSDDDANFAALCAVASIVANKATIPFGVNVQYNRYEQEWALCNAVGADFLRAEAFVENRVGIHGVSEACAPGLMRLRSRYPAKAMIFADINTKHTFPLVDQPVDFSVHEAVESGADALIVTGLLTGQNPTLDEVASVKLLAKNTPVILGSGISKDNVRDFFTIADGAIVGSSLKIGKNVFNRIDVNAVYEFVNAAR